MAFSQINSLQHNLAWQEVATDADLEDLIDEAIACGAYAIDTEFHTEKTYFPKLALVQIAYGAKSAIVDPFSVDISLMARLLASDAKAIFHAGDQDLKILYDVCHLLPKSVFDTQLAAGFLGFSTPSLSLVIDKMLNVVLDKGSQLTDWTKRPLGAEQKLYAINDVRYLIHLHDMMESQLVSLGRLDWHREECQRLLLKSRQPQDPKEAWWKIKQFRQLKGIHRGIAQEAAAWRETRAREMNLPLRYILSDLALAAIANRPPHSIEDLAGVRDMDLAKTDLKSLFASIERGKVLPESELVFPQAGYVEDRMLKPILGLSLVYVAEKARQLFIDQAILATRTDLALFYKDPSSGLIRNSWRFDLIGEPLLKLFKGEASLAFGKDGSVVLEQRSYDAI